VHKSNITLILFILIGLLAGSIIGQLLSEINGLAFLAKSAQISWEPKADLQAIAYDIHVVFKLNLISLFCVIAAIWIYRKI
jgi:hypothetical protein